MRIDKLMSEMNYNMGHPNHKSDLGNIQNMITEWFFENLTKSTLDMNATKAIIDNYEANLFDNPDMFDPDVDYSSISNSGEYFNYCKANYENSKINENSMKL